MEGQGVVTLLLPDGREESAEAHWSFSATESQLWVNSPFFGVLRGTGHDLLAALAQVRRIIEVAGARVLCNGSRIDADMSPMLSQGAGASMVYLLDGIPRGERPPTVPIFGVASRDRVATLEEQA